MAHSVRSGRLVGWWVYQRKVCVHASKSRNRKVSYRQKRVKKDEEQSGVIRQLVGRRGIFSQTKGRKQHLAAAWWGSPLMSASCLHHTDEVMISRPPRQRRFFSSAAANTCSYRDQVSWRLHHVVKIRRQAASAAEAYCPMPNTCNMPQQQEAAT